MPTGFDHIVIAVRDLDQTTADYTEAGFTVTPGGDHKGGATGNVLVTFQDGAYFELIAFKQPDVPQEHRWWQIFSKGEGLVDFALATNDLDQEVVALRAAGLNVQDPLDGGRFRPDGQRIDWRTLGFGKNRSSALPFYCHDQTERSLRVPGGEASVHANGVTGVRGLTVVVADLDAASNDFAALTGVAGTEAKARFDGVAGARRFALGAGWIELVQPTADDSDLRRTLDVRGERPIEVALIAPNGDETHLPIEQTHGARIRLTQ